MTVEIPPGGGSDGRLTGAGHIAGAIATAVRDAGGRALVVGGWVRDRLMDASRPRISTSRSSACGAERLRDILDGFGRVDTVGESFTVYKIAGTRRVAAAPRIEDRPRPPRIRGGGRSGDVRCTRPRAGATSPSMRSRGIR